MLQNEPIQAAQPYLTDEDRIAARRLSGLLEYVQELVKLDERVATSLSQHKLADGSKFALHEHELRGLPGVTFDISDAEGPIWLRVQRLQRVASPAVPDEVRDWIEVSNDPFRLPSVRETRYLRISNSEMDTLLANGEAREEDCAPSLKEEKDEAAGTAYFDVM